MLVTVSLVRKIKYVVNVMEDTRLVVIMVLVFVMSITPLRCLVLIIIVYNAPLEALVALANIADLPFYYTLAHYRSPYLSAIARASPDRLVSSARLAILAAVTKCLATILVINIVPIWAMLRDHAPPASLATPWAPTPSPAVHAIWAQLVLRAPTLSTLPLTNAWSVSTGST